MNEKINPKVPFSFMDYFVSVKQFFLETILYFSL